MVPRFALRAWQVSRNEQMLVVLNSIIKALPEMIQVLLVALVFYLVRHPSVLSVLICFICLFCLFCLFYQRGLLVCTHKNKSGCCVHLLCIWLARCSACWA